MTRLKEIVLGAKFDMKGGGSYVFVENFAERYIADLTNRPKIKRKLKVIAACGNGTAGAFAPRILEAIGCEVIPLDCELDHTFPNYNPNTEDMKMLHAMRDAVLKHKADVALGFDGDGDRCGVVDNEGEEIFFERVGRVCAGATGLGQRVTDRFGGEAGDDGLLGGEVVEEGAGGDAGGEGDVAGGGGVVPVVGEEAAGGPEDAFAGGGLGLGGDSHGVPNNTTVLILMSRIK